MSQKDCHFQIVITVWNALVVARWRQKEMLSAFNRHGTQRPAIGLSFVRGMIDVLEERERFARDRRAKGNRGLREKSPAFKMGQGEELLMSMAPRVQELGEAGD